MSARVSALVYNTSEISASQLPSSILELAEPKWKGKLGFAPSETDFQPLITAIVKLDGTAAAERWLKGLQANGKTYPDNETVVAQVNNGESAVGPINHYYWYRLRAEIGAGAMHSALHYYAAGDPGDLVNVSGGGRAAVELAPGGGAAVPRLPRQPRRPGDDRAQRQLRVPAAPGCSAGAGAARRSPQLAARRR